MLKKSLIEQHNSSLSNAALNVEQLVGQVLMTTNLLISDERIVKTIYGGEVDNGDIYGIISELKRYKSVSEFISNIAIVNRTEGYTVYDAGKVSFDDFFTESYAYGEYSLEFWREFTVSPSGYDVLPISARGSRSVIPVVLSGLSNIKSQNLVIIDIDCQKLHEKFFDTYLPSYSNVFIYDVKSEITVSDKRKSYGNINIRDFIEKTNEKKSFNYKDGINEYLIVSAENDYQTLNNLFYVSVITVSDLMSGYNHINLFVNLIILAAMILSILLSFRLSSGLYAPIKKLFSLTGNSQGSNGLNEFESISKKFNNLINDNRYLNKELSGMTPLALERYVLKYLNSNESDNSHEIDAFFNKGGISFKYDYFTVCLVSLKYTDSFYRQFSYNDYQTINTAVMELFITAFKSGAFLVPTDKDKFLIIFNISEDSAAFDRVIEKISELVSAFDSDAKLVKVRASIGKPYEEYAGMRKSYNECKKPHSSFLFQNKSKVLVYEDSGGNYKYDIDEENKIFNSILKGDYATVSENMNEIVLENINNGIASQNLIELYRQFYKTVINVCRKKGINERELMADDYVDISLNADYEVIVDYVDNLAKEVSIFSNLSNTKVDVKAISGYIDSHFAEDIYLDLLAEKFNTSAKYMSRLLKSHFGITFGEYLTRERVEHAKKLLTSTNKPINDVISECGYYNRNTFIRAFKKYTGLVPSEYRSLRK
jgi:AraC-like DNA-binding protein